MKLSTSSKSAELVAKWAGWSAQNPVLAIVLVSLAAIAVNCYPVIFCGKSFVAPAYGVPMVYGRYPTLPGMPESAEPLVAHGSDTGAMEIWGVPVGFIQSRSVLDHGELPLWNRYSHAGDPLLGQAVSMLGDPLQWIVILGRGSSGAWDLKFVLAKLMFCIGFGLLIRRLLGSVALGMIFAALGAYCGVYYFIFSHPVFFVFSYTPWILLSALEVLDLRSNRCLLWGLVWLIADFGCFNGGHVEPAVVLIGGLNCAALAFALATNRAATAAVRVLARIGVATALFLALTAPMWLSFLVALQGSFSLHSEVRVVQFHFANLLGIFDDVFFRLPVNGDFFMAPAPGTSFLVFVGCVYAMIRWRMLKHEPFFWINTAAIALWGGCIFGWIPSSVLSLVPMLNRVGHTHTDFSYLVIIHLTIQCAYGFRCLGREETFRRAANGLLWTGLIVAAITLLFSFGMEHGPILWAYYGIMLAGAFGAPLLFSFLKARGSLTVFGALGILILAFIPHFRFGFYNFGNEYLLMVPRDRVVLDAPSPAINQIKADQTAPFRIVGAEMIFTGDYAGTYGLEDIRSCEPLSNNEFVSLLRGFPGILAHPDWQVDLTNLVAAHPLLNFLNIKYVLTPPAVNVQDGLGFRLAGTNDLGIIENLEAWPRAYFCNTVIPISLPEQFTQFLLANGTTPFAALTPDQILAQPELQHLQAATKPVVAPAAHYKLLPNSTAFDIHADSAGVVCLTEGQAKDFTATANGEARPVFTVNRAFKGIYLEKPGDYHIQFVYRPRYWRQACALFWTALGVALVLAAFGMVACRRKETAAPANPEIQTR
jgi:hypothetical protein